MENGVDELLEIVQTLIEIMQSQAKTLEDLTAYLGRFYPHLQEEARIKVVTAQLAELHLRLLNISDNSQKTG